MILVCFAAWLAQLIERKSAVREVFSVTWSAGDVKEPTHLLKKSRGRSSRCGGLSVVSLHISCMGWVGE